MRDLLGISLDEMIFIGDALFEGGNDYPVKEAGPGETKSVVEAIIACLERDEAVFPEVLSQLRCV